MKDKCKGTGAVFSFTVIQAFKGKAQMVMTIIIAVVILASMPFMDFLSKTKGTSTDVEAQTIYVVDETGKQVGDLSGLAKINKNYANVKFVNETRSADAVIDQLKKASEDDKSLLIIISLKGNMFNLRYVVKGEGDLSESEVESMSPALESYFGEVKLKSLGVTEENLSFMNEPVATKVTKLTKTGDVVKSEEPISLTEYNILLVGIVFMIFCIAMSGETVAQTVASEKTTKLVETLLTSVKPMALILGKVLGALTIVLSQLALYVVCGIGSAFISMFINHRESIQLPVQVQAILDGISLTSVTPLSIILAVLAIAGGISIFGLIAGLLGATISRIEELAEGLKGYSFTMIIGAYAAIAIAIVKMSGGSIGIWETIAYIFPITSPFLLPMNLLLGKVTLWLAIVSLVVMAAFIILLWMFVARAYHVILLYSGNRLKIKDLFRIAKDEKRTNHEGGALS